MDVAHSLRYSDLCLHGPRGNGVYPVAFELDDTDAGRLYPEIFRTLLAHGLVAVDDLVIFTKGDLTGVTGSTNAMTILKVTA